MLIMVANTVVAMVVVEVKTTVWISNDGREFEGFIFTSNTKKLKRWRNNLWENIKGLSNNVR